MPHVIVKLWLGRSEEQKTGIAQRITEAVMNVLNCGEESVSVREAKSNQAIGQSRSIGRTFAAPPTPDTRCERYEQSFIYSLSLMHSLWLVGISRAGE
jgi:Tautomerase enzyme